MASIRKMAGGKYKAEVARQGVRKSRRFDSRQAAKDWAARQEYLILNSDQIESQITVGELFDRYAREVSPKKRGARWEIVRLERLKKDKLAEIRISDIRPFDFSDWRDRRLKDVAPATVNREMVLMSGAFTVARKEWGLISVNPMSDVRKPPKPAARDRRPLADEMDRLAHSAGDDLSVATARAYHAFLFAIETGMRAGEIVGLDWAQVDIEARVCHLPVTKNGTARSVPLSRQAVRLLQGLPHADPVFGLTSPQLDALWRKVRDRAGISDLHFHDSRHEAITRLAKKLDVLSLARMVGHRDIRMLQIYYNETAQELAKRLD